jgi:DNA-binding CsgD family transcriptional regulator
MPRREQLARLGLTRREGEVLAVAARGLDEQGIARALAISRRTVNKHLEHTYRKLNVSDRSQAIATAFDAAGPTRHEDEPTQERAISLTAGLRSPDHSGLQADPRG